MSATDGWRGLSQRGRLCEELAAICRRRLADLVRDRVLAYRARTLWPAVFLHSFHNTISQWLYPKLFASSNPALLDGEGGILPMAGYVVLGAALFVWMRRRGPSWRELTRDALSFRG